MFINNTFTYPDSCTATARYHESTFWGDLNVHCADGTCSVIQQSETAPLKFNDLNITGANVDLNMVAMEAKSIYVEVEKGILTFNKATLK